MKKLKLFLLCICVFALTSCSPITRASGEVTDVNGLPLADVTIKIIGKSLAPDAKLEFTTKSDGRYNFEEFYVSAQNPIEIRITAERAGFGSFSKELKFDDSNVNKIVLEKAKN